MGKSGIRSLVQRHCGPRNASFDYKKAGVDLGIPPDFEVMAMIAIGKKGSTEILPPELQEKEKLTDRKPLKEIIMEGFYHA